MTSSKHPHKTQALQKIRDEIFDLKESPLYAERVKNKVYPVIGEGSHDAKIMFVGEAPGRREAETGRPFAGAAGKVLDELLASIQLPCEEVYITNVVKDRPPNNRDPLPEEIALYAPFLYRQIETIQPKVIVSLGRISMKYIMETFGLASELKSISQIHGKLFEAKAPYGKMSFVPFYHPAATLYNPALRQQMEKDFQVLRSLN
jgi:DNA polymerase